MIKSAYVAHHGKSQYICVSFFVTVLVAYVNSSFFFQFLARLLKNTRINPAFFSEWCSNNQCCTKAGSRLASSSSPTYHS